VSKELGDSEMGHKGVEEKEQVRTGQIKEMETKFDMNKTRQDN
jgi:hypothetical protein